MDTKSQTSVAARESLEGAPLNDLHMFRASARATFGSLLIH